MSEIALVTGSARRVGRAIAEHLASQGYGVVVHYGGSEDAARAVVARIEEGGGRAAALAADLTQASEAAGLIERAAAALGQPSVLVNNASLFEYDNIRSVTPESFSRHVNINLASPLFLSQAFAAALPEGSAGNIINLLDQRVWKLTPNFLSYTVSKTGLWTVTQTLAQALAPHIRVNAIGPGPTLKSVHQDDADFARQQAAVPLGRGPSLAEICRAIIFLLESPSVTGQMLALDGGQHLAWQTPDVLEAERQSRNRDES